MAQIIRISKSTPHSAYQFKTSRNAASNPFAKNPFAGNSFDGNTLDLDVSAFADVFGKSAVKDTSKMKLIAASVAGTMHKLTSGITEPIINFVNRVTSSISSAWDYAKNTNISDVAAFKGINEGLHNIGEFMNKPIEIPGSHAVESAIEGVKIHLGAMNENVLDLGKGISSQWNSLISKISLGHNHKKISSDMPVAELEALWKSEIAEHDIQEVA